jgi:hypothetical protein
MLQVLCASNDTHDQVDPVNPPEGVPLGERVTFEGCARLLGGGGGAGGAGCQLPQPPRYTAWRCSNLRLHVGRYTQVQPGAGGAAEPKEEDVGEDRAGAGHRCQ